MLSLKRLREIVVVVLAKDFEKKVIISVKRLKGDLSVIEIKPEGLEITRQEVQGCPHDYSSER